MGGLEIYFGELGQSGGPRDVPGHEAGGPERGGSDRLERAERCEKGEELEALQVLASYLRGRALKLIKHTPEENGYEAWRLLLRDMQPSTRQRALALMTQLSRMTFAPNKSIMEQLPAYEALAREYERVSSQEYPEDLKVASILSACPVGMRTQLQMMVNEETTFESLKGRIEQYEAITTKWSAENVLGLPSQTTMEGPTPMDVDYIGG